MKGKLMLHSSYSFEIKIPKFPLKDSKSLSDKLEELKAEFIERVNEIFAYHRDTELESSDADLCVKLITYAQKHFPITSTYSQLVLIEESHTDSVEMWSLLVCGGVKNKNEFISPNLVIRHRSETGCYPYESIEDFDTNVISAAVLTNFLDEYGKKRRKVLKETLEKIQDWN